MAVVVELMRAEHVKAKTGELCDVASAFGESETRDRVEAHVRYKCSHLSIMHAARVGTTVSSLSFASLRER